MPAQGIPRMIGGLRLRRVLVASWCLVAAGCAAVTNEPSEHAIETAGPVAAAITPPAVDDAATPESPSSAAAAARTDPPESSIEGPPMTTEPTEPEPARTSVSPANIAPRPTELAVVAPAAPVTQEFEAAPSLSPSSAASPTSAETLDFSSLVTRLRKTKAIGLRTKVAVKNESDELLEQFRAYHMQHGVVKLGDLRSSYDSLFQKLHSLLEDADPPLARDIDRSRAAIWELLADPRKFSASQLMAGA